MTQEKPKSITPGDLVWVDPDVVLAPDALSGDLVELQTEEAVMYLGLVRPQAPAALIMTRGLIMEVPRSSLRPAP